MSIVWLAAYPKSGSTWTRTVLTNYLRADDAPASINDLIGGTGGSRREWFDDHLGLESSDMTPDEVLRHRPLFQEQLAAELPRPTFFKAHDAYILNAAGAPVFSAAAAAGAVYLIRNPLDVAVSYAHHMNRSTDWAVAKMGRATAAEWGSASGIHAVMPQRLLSWSSHVRSWLEQREIPLHVARYEDMLADPAGVFGAIVRFAGLDCEAARLGAAIEHASFDRLRAQEAQAGYAEKQPTARSFFRSGTAGGWRSTLDRRQVQTLVDAHGPIMERFGYLHGARRLLAERAATPSPAGGMPCAPA